MAIKTKKSKIKIRKTPSPEQLQIREQRLQKKSFQGLLSKLGFHQLATDGIEFIFCDRTGEIDDLFIFENILLITEYTVGKPNSYSAHLLKKKVLYDKILADINGFIALCRTIYPNFNETLDSLYDASSCQIKILYVTKSEPSDELMTNCPDIHFIYGASEKYFQALIKTIEGSARIEFLKSLGLEYFQVGKAALQTSHESITYQGFLLPERNSSYPDGYKIVSFYADPERLITKGYVLRRDSWRDESHLYQRILIAKKIKQMRHYLVEEGRVFVNNVIVTLPPETILNEPNNTGKNIDSSELGKVRSVSVQIPAGFSTIGIIDGQHRIFCYHEGSDRAEIEISKLRQQQNLMVTGIIYPPNTSDIVRRSFEAKLFLEINDNQTSARSSLKQDIEVIIRPYSGIAIAKRIVQELGRRGPLKGMLQTSYFDSPNKIKTSSIVSYGLRPLVKLDGKDSLYFSWENVEKLKLKEIDYNNRTSLLEEYIDYCTKKINELIVEVKLAKGNSSWDIDESPRNELLSPTAINGLFVCLRQIISSEQTLTSEAHKRKLKSIDKLEFSSFKSSQWQRLGTKLFDEHYESDQGMSAN